MRLSKTFGANLILLTLSTLVALFITEWAVGKILFTPAAAALASSAGVDFDTRSRLEVVLDCRKRDPFCYPAVPPNTFLSYKLEVNGERVLPLSGVARARVVSCNESGLFSTYTTDEYGFRNPEGAWGGADIIDLAFVGDSYTQGDCVNDGDHFVDHLRTEFSKVLNLGAGGDGPLFELATVREYLEGNHVRYLFWVFFERNDLSDLDDRKKHSLLANYLTPGFSQRLVHRQKEIDDALRAYVEHRIKVKDLGRATVLPNLRLLIWKLRNGKLFPRYNNSDPDDVPEYDIDLFQKILREATNIVEENGGQLVFVYLPEYERFNEDTPSAPWSAARLKPEILKMLSELGLDVIDIEAAFRKESDPLDLFPFKLQGHYNSKGYAVVAAEIMRYLEAQGISSGLPFRSSRSVENPIKNK